MLRIVLIGLGELGVVLLVPFIWVYVIQRKRVYRHDSPPSNMPSGKSLPESYRSIPILSGPTGKVEAFVEVAFPILVIFVMADVMILGIPFAHRLYVKAMNRLGLQVTELLMGFAVFLSGWGAYEFKKKSQITYGTIEVAFAVAVAIVSAWQMTQSNNWSGALSALGGSAYVVSRGLGNRAEGKRNKVSTKEAPATSSPILSTNP